MEAQELSANSKNVPEKKQMSIRTMVMAQRSVKLDINDPKSKEIHRAIGEMIAIDNQPYSLVDDEGFIRLLGKIAPNYAVSQLAYECIQLNSNIVIVHYVS